MGTCAGSTQTEHAYGYKSMEEQPNTRTTDLDPMTQKSYLVTGYIKYIEREFKSVDNIHTQDLIHMIPDVIIDVISHYVPFYSPGL